MSFAVNNGLYMMTRGVVTFIRGWWAALWCLISPEPLGLAERGIFGTLYVWLLSLALLWRCSYSVYPNDLVSVPFSPRVAGVGYV